MKKKIYIAGSFSNEEERTELERLIDETRLIHQDDDIYVPMEHLVPGGNEKDANGNFVMDNREWAYRVYEMDKKAIDECDEMIALYRGRYSGTGTAWEIGYAHALGKKIILHISDNADVASLMILNSANVVISNKFNEQK